MTRSAARPLSLATAFVLAACGTEPEPVSPPEPLFSESPFEYPASLWDTGVEGETVMMVHVTSMGTVDSAYVAEPSGHAAFDAAAVAGSYELRFAPARRGDRRIAMWARLPVRFRKPVPTDGGTR